MGDVINMNIEPTLYGITYGDVGGRNVQHEFIIQKYTADDLTPWQKMRAEMLETTAAYNTTYRYELALGWLTRDASGKQVLQIGLSMIGDEDWLKGVEWFKSYIGDMGGSAPMEAQGFGIIDKTRKLRVEFDGEKFIIRALKE